jgi:hypothetical protein
MNEAQKITPDHLSRVAIVYLRQSSASQVERNRESTDRQYALTHKAHDLGWPHDNGKREFPCTFWRMMFCRMVVSTC